MPSATLPKVQPVALSGLLHDWSAHSPLPGDIVARRSDICIKRNAEYILPDDRTRIGNLQYRKEGGISAFGVAALLLLRDYLRTDVAYQLLKHSSDNRAQREDALVLAAAMKAYRQVMRSGEPPKRPQRLLLDV